MKKIFSSILVVLMTLVSFGGVTLFSSSDTADAFSNPTGSITGYVYEAEGHTPLEGVQVLTVGTLSNFFSNTFTDQNGSYTLADLPENEYIVSAVSPGWEREFWQETHLFGEATKIVLSAASMNVSDIDFTLVPGGVITGTVTSQDTGTPVNGLMVQAFCVETGYVYIGFSDETGYYTIPGLRFGNYRVQAPAPTTQTDWKVEFFNNKTSDAEADIVNVSSDNPVAASIDFSLEPKGAISGRVTDNVTGLPVSSAQVNVLTYASLSGNHNFIKGTQTNTDGYYMIAGIPDGEYAVRIDPGNDYVLQYYPYTPFQFNALPVTISEQGSVSGIDFSLKTGGSIIGTAIDSATSQPIANLQINAMDFNTNSWMAGTQTDGNGTYTLVVPTGTFKVQTHAANTGLNYVDEFYNGKYGGHEADSVTVTGAETVENIDFSLAAAGYVTGTVIDSSSSLPIFNLHVYATDYNTDVWTAGTNTDVNGNYTLVLPAGTYRVRTASAVSGLSYIDQFFNNTGDFGSATPVSVTVSSTTSHIDFNLESAGSISGRVTDNVTGLPIGGVPVNVLVYDTLPFKHVFVNGTQTNPDGYYTVNAIPDGTYALRIDSESNYVLQYYAYTPNQNEALPVTISGHNDVTGIDFSLKTGGTISGTVIDSATSQPIVNLQISAMDAETDRWMAGTKTDVNGDYLLTVPDGTFNVGTHCAATGLHYVDEYYNGKYGGHNADVITVNAPETVSNIDFSLETGGFVTGHIVDSSSSLPIPDLHVYATDFTTDVWMGGANTDVNGNYTLVLPEGTYRIRACATCSRLNYFDEFYDGTDDFGAAVPVSVTVSSTTPGIDFNLEPIRPVRDLTAVVGKGRTFNVVITFSSVYNDFNAIGLADLVPQSWTFSVNNTWCVPAAMESHIVNSKVHYIWDGPVGPGTTFTAVYQVTVPFDAVPGQYTFDGNLEYYVGDKGPFTLPVLGDSQLTVLDGAVLQGETREANGSILPGVRVSLKEGPSVVSDIDGLYRIIVPTPGTHTFIASKTGYRSETFEIDIPNIDTYILNFKGNSGLIPNAPDMSYVLACINKWKFPPAELGLELSKVLAVINAWKYPVNSNPDEPKYGGVLNIVTNADITVWNPAAVAMKSPDELSGLVLEQILGIDRSKGPAGTGETSYIGGPSTFGYVTGELVESWTVPEIGVWVFNIRQGIHFGYHPGFPASELVNGREMTAEDVAFSLEYMRDNPTMSSMFTPGLMQNMVVERTGPWQITVRTPVDKETAYMWLLGGSGVQYVWPKEFLQAYGTSNNWQDVVGTGPYLIDNYVQGSLARYVRNDNYWDTNPVGPGAFDELPYINSINYLIIPDDSTRLAALRTGLADWSAVDTLTKPELDTLLVLNPETQSIRTVSAPLQVSGRIDTQNPFADVRVRKAMMLAIDHPGIVANYYGGQAELLDSPARKWYSSVYTPLNELPEAVRELYGYSPFQAKQLLAEAGYPNGMKMKLILSNSPESENLATIIREYWAAIGIDLQLEIQSPAVFVSTWVSRQSEDLMLSSYPGGTSELGVRYGLAYFRGANIFNMSHVNEPPGTDPTIETAYNTIQQNIMTNYPAADQTLKNLYPYILEQAFLIPMPAPWRYRVWQPWVKNYYGESSLKFWLKYAWNDQDLKYAMTGR